MHSITISWWGRFRRVTNLSPARKVGGRVASLAQNRLRGEENVIRYPPSRGMHSSQRRSSNKIALLLGSFGNDGLGRSTIFFCDAVFGTVTSCSQSQRALAIDRRVAGRYSWFRFIAGSPPPTK